MEKRVLAAFALSLLVVVVFSLLQPRPAPTPPGGEPGRVEPVIRDPASPEPPEPAAPPAVPAAAVVPSGSRVVVETDLYRATFDPLGARLVSFGLKDFTRAGEDFLETVPADTWYPFEVDGYRDVVFEADRAGLALGAGAGRHGELAFTARTAAGRLTKRFTFDNDRYGFDLDIELADAAPVDAGLRLAAFSQLFHPADRHTVNEIVTSARGELKRLRSGALKGAEQHVFDADFLALRSQYVTVFMRPGQPQPATVAADDAGNAAAFFRLAGPSAGSFHFYTGPSDHAILLREGSGIAEAMPSGPMVVTSRFILRVLTLFHRLVPNWGVAIILLTLLFKLVFFPLTRTSLRTMRTMQKIQPLLKDLSAKYKNNPQAMQKEMFGIYRQYRVNPMGGCLPMLLQVPVFIAMFVMLRTAVVLRGAPFALWITDLSMPDALTEIAGFQVNVLPVLMGVTMFFQQKMSGQASIAAGPTQAQQQKMMLFMMPVMLTVFLYTLPAGLMLYWTTTNLFSIVEHRIVARHIH